MADVLPSYDRPGYGQRVSPQVIVPDRVGAGTFQKASMARGLAQTGDALADAAMTVYGKEQERIEHARKVALGHARNEAMLRARQGLFDDFTTAKGAVEPGAPGFTDAFNAAVEKRRKAELDRIDASDQEARDLVGADFDQLAQSFQFDAMEFQAAERVRYRQQTLQDGLDVLGNVIVSSPERMDDFLAQGMASIDAADADLSPEGRAMMEQSWKQTAALSSINGLMSEDPGQVLADLREGRFDHLIEPTQKASAIAHAENEIDRLKAKAIEAANFEIADLELAIHRGAASQEQIDAARKRGLFDKQPHRYVTLSLASDRVAKGIAEAEAVATSIRTRLASGYGLNSQKEADIGFAERAKFLDPNNSEQFSASVAQYAVDSGWLISPFKQKVINAERRPDADNLAEAAQIHASIKERAPWVDTGAGDNVALVTSLVADAGLDWDDAATQVVERLPDASTLKERTEKLKDMSISEEDLQNNAGKEAGLDAWFGETTVPEMMPEYRRRVQAIYKLNGDEATAKSVAAQLMNQTWGLSVFRDGKAMKYPVERYKPPSGRAMPDDKYKEAVDGEILGMLNGLGIGDRQWRLEVDEAATKDRAREGKSPAYQIRVENQFGALVPIPDDEGKPVLFFPPNDEELQATPAWKSMMKNQREKLRRGRLVDAPIDEGNSSTFYGSIGEEAEREDALSTASERATIEMRRRDRAAQKKPVNPMTDVIPESDY